MLIFSDHGVALLSVPKTGSTALEGALGPWADVALRRKHKHANMRTFHNRIVPFMQAAFGVTALRTVCLIRAPEDRYRSWYKYRRRLPAKNPNSTRNLSFDDFIGGVLSDPPPSFAKVGNQHHFCALPNGKLGVDHIFSYERMDLCIAFLEEALDRKITLKTRNPSPQIDAPLSPDMARALEQGRAEEYALYQRVMDAGGALDLS